MRLERIFVFGYDSYQHSYTTSIRHYMYYGSTGMVDLQVDQPPSFLEGPHPRTSIINSDTTSKQGSLISHDEEGVTTTSTKSATPTIYFIFQFSQSFFSGSPQTQSFPLKRNRRTMYQIAHCDVIREAWSYSKAHTRKRPLTRCYEWSWRVKNETRTRTGGWLVFLNSLTSD